MVAMFPGEDNSYWKTVIALEPTIRIFDASLFTAIPRGIVSCVDTEWDSPTIKVLFGLHWL